MRFRSLLHPAIALFAALSAFGNVAPEARSPATQPTLRSGGAAQDLDLRTFFRDPDVTGSAVRVSVRIGSTTKTVDIALYDQEKPITVANFLAYVKSGRHNNNFFHRSVPGFVVQGGGFKWNASNGVDAVETYEKIQNEPGISNIRGTVAMAKLGGDPNSATSQWFVNLADNSANLDGQNGGFTVFGRVVGNGMSVIDEVAALPRVNAGSPFDTLPVKDFSGGTIQRVHTIETSSAVVPTLSFSAVSNDPTLVGVSVTGSTLRLSAAPNRSGSTTVSITATDLDGASTATTLPVNVISASAGWHVGKGTDGEPDSFILDPSDGSALSEDPVPVHCGSVFLAKSTSRTFTVRNNGSTTFSGLSLSFQGANTADFAVTSAPAKNTLAPSESTTFTVSFVPHGVGNRSATLHLAGADPNGASLNVLLSGVGLDIPSPTISPALVSPQTLQAGPTGTVEVPDWRGTLVTATDPSGLASFVQSPAPGTLQPLGTVALVFTARNDGGKVSSVQTTLTVGFAPVSAPEVKVTDAHVGAPAPASGGSGLPDGSVLSSFGVPAISDFRDLATLVTITAGRSKLAGIYRENGAGESELVAHQNKSAAGVPNAVFKSFRDPLLSPDGAIAFAAKLSGPKAAEDEGVWTDLFGDLGPVLREGAEIPGLNGLKLKSVTSISLADDALLALVKLSPSPGQVTAANNSALVRITGQNSGTLLVRSGTLFDGASIKTISVLQPAPRSPGQGRWSGGSDAVAKLTLSDKRTAIVRIKADGSLSKLLQSGAEDAKLGAKLAALGLPALGNPSVAVLVTKARTSGVGAANDSVLLHAPDGVTFAEIARENDSANVPDGAKFAGFSDPVTNDQGEVLFFGTLRGSTVKNANQSALWWTNGSGAPELIARLGNPAADKDGNPLTNTVWKVFTSYALPDGPNAGPVFLAQLSGKGVTAQTKLGLWSVDSNGATRLLLRTGDEITMATGKKRVTGINLLNALPGSFGARRSYNSTGSLAVQATFSDRSQAILRIDLP